MSELWILRPIEKQEQITAVAIFQTLPQYLTVTPDLINSLFKNTIASAVSLFTKKGRTAFFISLYIIFVCNKTFVQAKSNRFVLIK